jgi:hypothetical protein
MSSQHGRCRLHKHGLVWLDLLHRQGLHGWKKWVVDLRAMARQSLEGGKGKVLESGRSS